MAVSAKKLGKVSTKARWMIGFNTGWRQREGEKRQTNNSTKTKVVHLGLLVYMM
jgi:hypothetical protein